MADDYDENIFLDEAPEGTKTKKSKDFIPKPRLLTSPASTFASITGHSQASFTEEKHHEGSISSDRTDSPNNSRKVEFLDPHPSSRNSLASFNEDTENKKIESAVLPHKDPETIERPVHQELSQVNLVQHQSPVRLEDGTYKRLISQMTSVEEQSDDIEITHKDSPCLCRICSHPIIRKNWKVYVGAITLTLLGLALVSWGLDIGLNIGFTNDLKSIIFLVGGLVLFLPGFYHLIFLSLAAYDVRGFKFSKLPSIK
ncbi:uncharacterized protein [Watersipora subatra]|uniref:uncharacterized protein isoform X2 n=1 Tax=Watersipora subatra TaxID=2589382 RepID=UPI00355C16E9